MKHARVTFTVSLPSNLAENFEKLAKAESKNKSQGGFKFQVQRVNDDTTA